MSISSIEHDMLTDLAAVSKSRELCDAEIVAYAGSCADGRWSDADKHRANILAAMESHLDHIAAFYMRMRTR